MQEYLVAIPVMILPFNSTLNSAFDHLANSVMSCATFALLMLWVELLQESGVEKSPRIAMIITVSLFTFSGIRFMVILATVFMPSMNTSYGLSSLSDAMAVPLHVFGALLFFWLLVRFFRRQHACNLSQKVHRRHKKVVY